MLARTLPLALLLPLVACSSARPESEPVEPALRFTYHAAVSEVPSGAAEVRLGVLVPEQDGRLRALSLFGLVGNAPFEMELPETVAGSLEREHVRVSWRLQSGEDRSVARELVLATHGRPLEVGVRLALTPRDGTEPEARVLGAELAGSTWAEIDGQPAPAPATRCERTR